MNIAFFGSSDFVIPIAKSLLDSPEHDLKLVVSQPDRTNRSKVISNPVVSWARNSEIATWLPTKLKSDIEQADRVLDGIDLLVVASYGQIIPQAVLDIPKYGAINWHPSLLPAYRGPTPMQTALASGDDVSGLTWIKMTAGMDAGPIIQQFEEKTDHHTIVSLAATLGELGGHTVNDIIALHVKGHHQNQDESKITLTSMLTKEDRFVDAEAMTAEQVYNHWRAYLLFPGTVIRDSRFGEIKLKEVSVAADVVSSTPIKGCWYRTAYESGSKVVYKCADNTWLSIKKIQTTQGKQIDLSGYQF